MDTDYLCKYSSKGCDSFQHNLETRSFNSTGYKVTQNFPVQWALISCISINVAYARQQKKLSARDSEVESHILAQRVQAPTWHLPLHQPIYN